MPTPTDRRVPSSANSSDTSLNRVQNLPGYTTPVFKGKEEQRALVELDVSAKVPRLFRNPRDVSLTFYQRASFPKSSSQERSNGSTPTLA
jgi:hypothetical protein